MQFWVTLWTLVWALGMVVFSCLSVAIIVYGARDLVHLLRRLVQQHQSSDGPPPGA